jgi:plasmid replication initiation protein
MSERGLAVPGKARNLSRGVAVFDNKLIDACYRMTLTQKRLFNMAVAAVNSKRRLQLGKRVVVSIDDFAQLSGLTTQSAIYRCREAVADLISVHIVDIEYKNPNEILSRVNTKKGNDTVQRISHRNFFQEVEVLDTETSKVVSFVFSDWIVPFIAQIGGSFTKIQLQHINPLTSFYSMRLYESVIMAIKSNGGVHHRQLTVAELRHIFGLTDEKYKRWVDFKKRCIVSSINDLNEKTPFAWSFKVIGKGRFLQGVSFSATPQPQEEFKFTDTDEH